MEAVKLRPRPRTVEKTFRRSVCSAAATGRRYADWPNVVMNWVAQVVSAEVPDGALHVLGRLVDSLPAALPVPAPDGGVDDRVGGLVVQRDLQIGDAGGGHEPDGVLSVRRPGVPPLGRRGGVAEQIRQHVVVFAVSDAAHDQHARLLGWRRPGLHDPDVLGHGSGATAAGARRAGSSAARARRGGRLRAGPAGPGRVRGHTAERTVAGAHAGRDQNGRHRPDGAQVSNCRPCFRASMAALRSLSVVMRGDMFNPSERSARRRSWPRQTSTPACPSRCTGRPATRCWACRPAAPGCGRS